MQGGQKPIVFYSLSIGERSFIGFLAELVKPQLNLGIGPQVHEFLRPCDVEILDERFQYAIEEGCGHGYCKSM